MIIIKDWEEYFNHELTWTAHIRDRLYDKANLSQKKALLEIGCGSGELLKEIGIQFNLKLYGIDINQNKIKYAKENLRKNRIDAKLSVMNILDNQFQSQMFDVVITHFLFLWVKDLRECFNQIHRILKPDGVLLIFGEPDYGGLVEYPDTNLKKELFSQMKNFGADPEVGRKLNQFFLGKFNIEEHFCTSFPWISKMNKSQLLNDMNFFKEKLNTKKFDSDLMKKSIEEEKYFLFIPVFSYFLKRI